MFNRSHDWYFSVKNRRNKRAVKIRRRIERKLQPVWLIGRRVFYKINV